MVHAVCRRGLRLHGDGRSTIAELLNRHDRQVGATRDAQQDHDAQFTLAYQNLALNTVPEDGQEILVRSVNDPRRTNVEVRTVYTETVTDRISQGIVQQAERAAALLGSELLGVDIIATDVSEALDGRNGVINEVNTTPALHHHYDAQQERYPDVALKAVSALLGRRTRP